MKSNIQAEVEKTRAAVAQIICWCTVVALHQKYGIGGQRLEHLAERLDRIQTRYVAEVELYGASWAMQTMQREVSAYCDPVMRVPLNRAPRNRRERQLRMAGDQAATLSWCNFARAVHEYLGFGRQRLEVVKKETLDNYRQFEAWESEEPEWAMENLRRCVAAAMGEEVRVVDWNEVHEYKEKSANMNPGNKIEVEVATVLGRRNRPAGWAVENNAEKIRKAMDLQKQVNTNWRF